MLPAPERQVEETRSGRNIPNARITVPRSLVVIVPSPLLSKRENASLYSAICSSESCSAWSKRDNKTVHYQTDRTHFSSPLRQPTLLAILVRFRPLFSIPLPVGTHFNSPLLSTSLVREKRRDLVGNNRLQWEPRDACHPQEGKGRESRWRWSSPWPKISNCKKKNRGWRLALEI